VLRQAWRRLLRRAARSRAIAAALFVAGVYLVGLPLIFTVFAHEAATGHHVGRRIALTVVWFACAVVVGLIATAGDVADLRQRMREVLPRARSAGDRRELAALASIASLLEPGATGLSNSFRFNAFIGDDQGFLVPVLERDPAPWQRWAPGQGVVGIAWSHPEAFVPAVGPETVDPELRLSPEQQKRYGHLTFVAGQAIFDEYERQTGVLAVSCDDGSDFAEAGGPEAFQVLASDVGILIGDARPADT
jgi:hypothetical protein